MNAICIQYLTPGQRFRLACDPMITGTFLDCTGCRAKVQIDGGVRDIEFEDHNGEARHFRASRTKTTTWALATLVEPIFTPEDNASSNHEEFDMGTKTATKKTGTKKATKKAAPKKAAKAKSRRQAERARRRRQGAWRSQGADEHQGDDRGDGGQGLLDEPRRQDAACHVVFGDPARDRHQGIGRPLQEDRARHVRAQVVKDGRLLLRL